MHGLRTLRLLNKLATEGKKVVPPKDPALAKRVAELNRKYAK